MKTKTFPGGYRFKNFCGQPKSVLLTPELPKKVFIPLAQGFGSPVEPNVNVGDAVKAGQIIGLSDSNISSPVHSSISGKIVDIKTANYFKRQIKMIVIEGDGKNEYEKIEGYTHEWNKLLPEKLEEILYKSGVTSLDREGIPTHFKSSIIKPEEVENIIVHGTGSEPYNVSLEILLEGKKLYGFVDGIKILKRIMPKAKVYLALNKEKKAIVERISKLTSNLEYAEVLPVTPKYPQGYDEILVPTVLGKKFPYGYSAANIGIVVLNIQAVLHAYEAVVLGKPVIERIVALCGLSFKENIHVKVRVGTLLKDVLKGNVKDAPARVILNSLLTGFELNDYTLPVDRTFSQIVALHEDKERKMFSFMRPGLKTDSFSNSYLSTFLKTCKEVSTNCQGEKRPCIQCGYCVSVCPVEINPTLLDRYARTSIDENLMTYGIFNCIECNLCSYVCPSKIPLGNNLKEAKIKLIEIGCDNSICILPKFNLKGLEAYKGVKTIR